MAFVVRVSEELLEQYDLEIGYEHELLHYKPVVLAIVQNIRREILLLKTYKGNWVFPEAGVRAGERIINALLRVMGEQADIRSLNLTVQSMCYSDRLDMPNEPPDGFQLGERLYFFHAQCHDNPRVRLGEGFVAYQWFTPLLLAERLSSLRPRRDKIRSMLFALMAVSVEQRNRRT